ncbi:MAG: SAM-dependent methyltransferase [Kineosporiaceae bacterium]
MLVTAFELLDVVACPVVERDADGRWRRVHVQPATGRERLGARVDGDDAAWLARWWDGAADPDTRGEGARAEVGRSREEVWAGLVRAVADHPGGGVLLAVDYAHTLTTRPAEGSLAAFRAGRAVPPRADGNCDVTAHVAMDAVEAAGEAAGAVTIARLSQAEAIRRWWHGPSTPAAELRDPGALGGFSWLVQAVR